MTNLSTISTSSDTTASAGSTNQVVVQSPVCNSEDHKPQYLQQHNDGICAASTEGNNNEDLRMENNKLRQQLVMLQNQFNTLQQKKTSPVTSMLLQTSRSESCNVNGIHCSTSSCDNSIAATVSDSVNNNNIIFKKNNNNLQHPDQHQQQFQIYGSYSCDEGAASRQSFNNNAIFAASSSSIDMHESSGGLKHRKSPLSVSRTSNNQIVQHKHLHLMSLNSDDDDDDDSHNHHAKKSIPTLTPPGNMTSRTESTSSRQQRSLSLSPAQTPKHRRRIVFPRHCEEQLQHEETSSTTSYDDIEKVSFLAQNNDSSNQQQQRRRQKKQEEKNGFRRLFGLLQQTASSSSSSTPTTSHSLTPDASLDEDTMLYDNDDENFQNDGVMISMPTTPAASTKCNDSDDNASKNETTTKSFWMNVMDRAGWLVGLLVLQSLSSFIIGRNEALLQHHTVIIRFLTMLVGAGGNAGNQASVNIIRGLATNTIRQGYNYSVYIRSEMITAIALSCILGIAGMLRAAVFATPIAETVAITCSLTVIVFLSVVFGTLLPLCMKSLRIDPAHSSTTIQVIMDILGVTITVGVCSFILDSNSGISTWISGL